MTAIELRGLHVELGGRTVVDGVSFTVPWGSVTGFLGVNGAGKSTTIRRMLGLVAGTGDVRVADADPGSIVNPARVVGVAFDELLAYPGHTPRMHLEQIAVRAAIPVGRVPALLAEVGLPDSEPSSRRQRIAELSLGMRKRLAIAGALVGGPAVLVLDEPFDGLDPTGRRWLRRLVRTHADRGGAVLLSAHGLDEIAPVLDRVVVLDAGTVRFEGSTATLLARTRSHVVVRSPDAAALRVALETAGARVLHADGDRLHVAEASTEAIARIALHERLLVVELVAVTASLSDAFAEAVGIA